uniref:protein IWS1 homolog n=1 Tax=Monopterus albus TaxID=43700 RepID=UPI0009B450E5|nr:protein IWS1 homolog [Monopterus albus]
MEQSLSDLLSDAFSELDFVNLYFDEKFEEDKTDLSHENQEAAGEATALSSVENKDTYIAENVDEEQSNDKNDEEDFQGAGISVVNMDKTPEEDYTGSDKESEEEASVSGEDEDCEEEDMGTGERPGDLMMLVHCGDKSCYGNTEDSIVAEGQPLAPEGPESPQVINEEQGESESDEEVSYSGRTPEHGNEVTTKDDGIEDDEEREEEKQEDSSDSECEGMKIGQEENIHAQCFEEEVESPYKDGPMKVSMEFPEILVQNLQDLIAAVDSEECAEKIEDFIGEEHQEAGESDEEVSCSGRTPEHGNEVTTKDDGIEDDEEREEEKQEDSSDSECEGMKIEQEENIHAQCFEEEVESPYKDGPMKVSMEFPEILVQNLQDLIAAVDSEECAEKIEDFIGEEHQEAGESFADYPSAFSSCEYREDGGNQENSYNSLPCASDNGSNTKQNTRLEGAKDITCMEREDTDEVGDEYLLSRDLERDVDRLVSLDVAAGEKEQGETEIVENVLVDTVVTGGDDGSDTGESDSYSSSDDEVQVRGRHEDLFENMCREDLENKKLGDTQLYSGSSAAFSRWSVSDDRHITNNRENPPDFNINWDFDLLKPDTLLFDDLLTTQGETSPSGVSQCSAEDIESYSVVQRKEGTTTTPSNQGSLDDSFFFTAKPEASGISELEQLGADEYEEERNWEQEQERIKAFYMFYDDSEGDNGKEERQTKVQFCTDPLSQVIHYETDSDRESPSSSTDEEGDLSSTETSDELRELDNTLQIKPTCDPPYTLLQESKPEKSKPEKNCSNTHVCSKKHKCLSMLKLIVKMGLVILLGVLMFWLATEQADWLSHICFF